ncbi:molecular chaperone [Enterobacter sp. CC120223-11]|uniref:fimbrial biogenesis chaperone n=1 Tax=Enterobacter sp. CC120223-11 TaxID=1378073 RepID=UPI000BD7529D|nr:molecular chaperone [Enterobacter sp. CC120223-11]SNY79868.1 fimbrial chaperone protein [Enterobacter sp. CC120223-11]
MIQRLSRTLPCLLLALSLNLQAESDGISLGQTRIIFSAADKAQTVTVRNNGKRAYLIQARVQIDPDNTTAAPFIVTPPLFSLAGESKQLLRILPQGVSLPADRESVFYLFVSAIPAQSEPVLAADRLSVGFRFALKLFYRPSGLSPLADNGACLLTFKREKHGVRITNPTPYFQTLGDVSVNGTTAALDPQSAMIQPFGSTNIAVTRSLNALSWQTITDYGGLSQPCRPTTIESDSAGK